MTKALIIVLAVSVNFMQISYGNEENLANHNLNSTAFSRPMNFLDNDLLFLSELPLEKLLKVRKSLNELKQASFEVNRQNYDDESLQSRMIDERNFFGARTTKGGLMGQDDKHMIR